jgi:pimeloyl-ACP methyl ester carboxylesterase
MTESSALGSDPTVAAGPDVAHMEVAPGVRLHVERRAGPAGRPAFVLVHGLASNLRLWDGVAERLSAAGHPVVALDQRGHGLSDAPDHGYDLDTAVADLLAVVTDLGLVRPILVGQSWGGNVVLEVASRRPEVAQGLACVDGGLIELHEWFPSWEACLAALTPPRLDRLTLDALATRIRSFSPELPERAVGAILHCFRVRSDGTIEPRLTRDYHLQLLRALWEHRPSARLPGLAVPLLVLLADTGDEVRTAQKRHAEMRALGLTPRIRSRWFAPAHHDVHAQYPDRVAGALLESWDDGFFGAGP